MDRVTTRVSASTSNLGPGFDCLGVALEVFNRVTVSLTESATDVPLIVTEAADVFFTAAKLDPIPFSWSIEGDVPRARGLGSSVTVRLGVLHGLNVLTQTGLERAQLVELCAALEGHPDNAAPAEFGGFTVAGAGPEILRGEVAPELKFILAIPDFEISTPQARKVLPKTVPRLAAVSNVANACRITAAFLQQKYELLRGCFVDGLHQPYRVPLIPFLGKTIAAAETAGALGGFLSGSGSTICLLTLGDEQAVAAAVLDATPPGTRVVVTAANNQGAVIE